MVPLWVVPFIGLDPRLHGEKKVGRVQPTHLPSSCRCYVTNCFKVLPPHLHHYWLCPHTLRQNKPSCSCQGILSQQEKKARQVLKCELMKDLVSTIFLMPVILSTLTSILLEKSSLFLAMYFTYNFGVTSLNI